MDNNATEQPQYELRPRSKNYVGLWLGDHCLAVICVKTPRGKLDAQFLLRVANCHKELLEACTEVLSHLRTDAFMECSVAEDCDDVLQAAIEKAKKSDI